MTFVNYKIRLVRMSSANKLNKQIKNNYRICAETLKVNCQMSWHFGNINYTRNLILVLRRRSSHLNSEETLFILISFPYLRSLPLFSLQRPLGMFLDQK